MARRKRIIVLSVFIFAGAAAAALFFYKKTLRQYESGNLIQLIDLVSKSETRKEPVKNWIKIATLNEQTAIWKASSQFLISSHPSPRLWNNEQEFDEVKDIFQTEVTPFHWSYDRQSIWVSFPVQQNPVSAHFVLEYQTNALQLIPLKEALLKSQNLPSLRNPSRAIVFYETNYALTPCNGKISVYDHSNEISYLPQLAENQNIRNGWVHYDGANFTLFDANRAISLGAVQNAYENRRYYTSGIVRFRFLAAAHNNGNARLQFGVLLDDRKLGLLRISTNRFDIYSLQTYVHEGFHTLHAQFLNPSDNQKIGNPPIILLSRVSVGYLDAIVIASNPGSSAQHQYSINYCTPRETSFVENTDVRRDVQASLVLPALTHAHFKVKLPAQAILAFGYAPVLDAASERSTTHLAITVKGIFERPKKILSLSIPAQNQWRDQRVDLSAYSGKAVSLEFEASSDTFPVSRAPHLAIGNPLIFSRVDLAKKRFTNVFIITADALRADHLGCYGYERPTSPNIDLFAKDAVLFRNAVSQGAGTLPSTSSLFTSVYPSMHKTDFNTSKLSPAFLTLPEIARSQKYMTGGFVQNEFLSPVHGLSDGFLWYRYDTFPSKTEERLHHALAWIEDMRDFPLFVFFHMLHPHSPYVPPPEFAGIFKVAQMPLAASNQKLMEINAKRIALRVEEREQLITLYDAEIRHLDALFGEFIQRLKSLGLYDGALIIFLSDHGEGFQEHGLLLHGSSVYQNMIHVPLIMKFPASWKAKGITIDDYVQTMDLAPTILQLSGLPLQQYMQGKSLLRLVMNHSAPNNQRAIFSEVLSGKILCIIKDGYKYVFKGNQRKEELYDLNTDPQEQNDLSVSRADMMKKFRVERYSFMARAAAWRKKYQASAQGATIRLDQEQTEQLKALGYIH